MVPFTSLFTTSRFTNNTRQQPDTPSERLADLVHHLSEVPMSEARRAVHHNALAGKTDDPLAVIAGALVQLRNERRGSASAGMSI